MDCKYLTTENRKLMKFGGVSFDLPARKTCPKAGTCAKDCYAAKLARIYKGYAAKTERNFVLAKSAGFVNAVSAEIEATQPKYFRMHGGGDFYSQAYLNKWLEIMKRFPKVQFYAYSKSLHLEFGKPKNFTLIKSFGGKLDSLIKKTDYQALIIPKHGDVPKGYVEGLDNDLWWLDAKRVALRKH